jgi:acyl-CoA hydrolase
MAIEKTVSDSAVEAHTYKIFPNDLNSYDTVFGGMIMATIDRIALVVAERHSAHTCVTASVDSMHFLNPARRGDILLFSAALNCAWRTSMEIGVRVMSENPKTGEKHHILSAYLTFVALDQDRTPAEVPKLIPQSKKEKRRYEEAQFRREQRKLAAAQLKARREEQL